MSKQAYHASILHFLDDPDKVGQCQSYEYFEDGLLVIEDGKIVTVGEASKLVTQIQPDQIFDYRGQLLLPGLIDTHTHYPQTEMIASYGEQLLTWLETYTFPTEAKFGDEDYASTIAELFLDELLKNGTTTALAFPTVHVQSVDAFFEAAERRNLRMISGKVLMDRNAPENLRDTVETAYSDSKELIERWHNQGRLQYAVTPRFAPTSSEAQLEAAGVLLKETPGIYFHTHLAENLREIAWVKDLFPNSKNYLDCYDQFGLLGKQSIFAHCIHLEDSEWARLRETGSKIAHCPTSNLFLGSGLFQINRAVSENIDIGLGTDVGAGNTFSLLKVMADAYKVQQLNQNLFSSFKALYLATLGGARCLNLDKSIGNFLPGKEADFIVIDKEPDDFLAFRMQRCGSLLEEIFTLIMLGDDRCIRATYICGEVAHLRNEHQRA
ncbi:MAG: guanine deaminase [Candidatus Azotimanducaceae bacterium]|uniref:Guanine deaminase n=1 Tax=OM182 bacterium TaxID=2510334 RepID=A0A520S0I0_9GAMM|nr:MAG: guanine deaminase [OM182 bacterium]